jgi:peptide-methionine (R)-S-oxide reductase
MVEKVRKTNEEWKRKLDPDLYRVAREKGTERAYTGKYHDCKDPGTYRCACCGNAVFTSEAKFDSGTGWPSFGAPASGESVSTAPDHSLMMRRTEVLCAACDAHLGHVFDDGPPPTGRRYCINSISLRLDPDG